MYRDKFRTMLYCPVYLAPTSDTLSLYFQFIATQSQPHDGQHDLVSVDIGADYKTALIIKLRLLSSSYVRLDNKQAAVHRHRRTLSVPQRGGVWTSAPEGVVPVAESGRFVFFCFFFQRALTQAGLCSRGAVMAALWKLLVHDSFDSMKENSSSSGRQGG